LGRPNWYIQWSLFAPSLRIYEPLDVHLATSFGWCAPDSILWKLTNSGEYSGDQSARLYGLSSLIKLGHSPVQTLLLDNYQNRVWMARRLEKRGWPNGRTCPLCQRENETACHLLFRCRYSDHIWNMAKEWLGLTHLDPLAWTSFDDPFISWWSNVVITRHGLDIFRMDKGSFH
jgi:hypothetical protein